jgi:proteasome accessory factor C
MRIHRKKMDRFDRIYRLHGLLTNRRIPIPLTEIMDKLECSKATATRCIEELRIYLNAPLDYDRKRGGYFYNQRNAESPYELPGLWFSAEELNGLLICHQILQNISPGLLSQQITRLQQRIDNLFKIQHHSPADISQKIKLLSIGRRLKDDAQFKKTATALFNGKQINIHYNGRSEDALPNAGTDFSFYPPTSGKDSFCPFLPEEKGHFCLPLPLGEGRGEGVQKSSNPDPRQHTQKDRNISPHQLIYYRDNWYIAAYCHYRKQLRVFAIDNISSAKILEQTVERIDPKELEEFFTSSYGIFSGIAQHLSVLEFSKSRAKWVADESWHPKQQDQWLDNGNYQLSIPFNDSRELIMDILKHGAEVEVKAPEFLRVAVIKQIAAMQKIYKK